MPYRPTEKTEARKKAQYNLLLSTALTLVANEGFQNLTIALLAEQAQVAIGTVYKYFESKADLCAAVFRQATEKEVAKVQLAAFPEDSGESCEQRLLNAIKVFAERALEGYRLAYALIAEPVDAMVQHERLKYRQAYGEIFEGLIEEAITSKEFCEQDALVTAAALVGTLSETLLGSIGSHMSEAKAIDQQKLIKDIQGFCLRAVKS
jgi:AcrR family transcriptional regulator